jgi:hypothetical protein
MLSIIGLCVLTLRALMLRDIMPSVNMLRHCVHSVFILSFVCVLTFIMLGLLSVVILIIIMLNVIMLNFIILIVIRMLSFVMLCAIMLNVIIMIVVMPSVIMKSVVMLSVMVSKSNTQTREVLLKGKTQ